MTKLAAARRAALAALSDARRRSGRIRDIIRTHRAFLGLSAADRALATRLAVGAVSALNLLDELITERVRRPSSLEPRVKDALRIAAFELLYLETPQEVAVSQGVELVRSVAPRATALANALLRRIGSELRPQIDAARDALIARAARPDELRLVSGLPLWLLDRILHDRGAAAAASLAQANLEPAPVYVFAEDPASLERFSPLPTDLDATFELQAPGDLFDSGLVQSGAVVVSDLSAQRICALIAAHAPASILEVGQGSGTKTLIIARRCDAEITAIDLLGSKVAVARERLDRAGLGNRVASLSFDATHLGEKDVPPELDRLFDLVFVDAPCSGTGTMRRHPEIASTLTSEAVSELARLQLELLSASSIRVAPGGKLIYSTCSVLIQENEAVIDAFLASCAGADFVRTGTDLQSFPAPSAPDGHYCAVLTKRGVPFRAR